MGSLDEDPVFELVETAEERAQRQAAEAELDSQDATDGPNDDNL
jgi:hypothetical protein